ncbi:hypothetical protein E2C01_079482 [Portunus trituberculatus]|uniref:Uncharacterized protein n=1 Tax=Portunus trituberculatus TaxID=210409 RepID=A0A5B7IQQ7_PORTR|nr:hypothetical protein [Portunus trituberculatus]
MSLLSSLPPPLKKNQTDLYHQNIFILNTGEASHPSHPQVIALRKGTPVLVDTNPLLGERRELEQLMKLIELIDFSSTVNGQEGKGQKNLVR